MLKRKRAETYIEEEDYITVRKILLSKVLERTSLADEKNLDQNIPVLKRLFIVNEGSEEKEDIVAHFITIAPLSSLQSTNTDRESAPSTVIVNDSQESELSGVSADSDVDG